MMKSLVFLMLSSLIISIDYPCVFLSEVTGNNNSLSEYNQQLFVENFTTMIKESDFPSPRLLYVFNGLSTPEFITFASKQTTKTRNIILSSIGKAFNSCNLTIDFLQTNFKTEPLITIQSLKDISKFMPVNGKNYIIALSQMMYIDSIMNVIEKIMDDANTNNFSIGFVGIDAIYNTKYNLTYWSVSDSWFGQDGLAGLMIAAFVIIALLLSMKLMLSIQSPKTIPYCNLIIGKVQK